MTDKMWGAEPFWGLGSEWDRIDRADRDQAWAMASKACRPRASSFSGLLSLE